MLAFLSEGELIPTSLNQLATNEILKIPDMLTDRTLRNAQFLGRQFDAR